MFNFGYLLIAGCLIPLTTSSGIDCSREQFLCDSGDQCVNRSKWCDKKSDCEDGSDELYCRTIRFYTSDDPNGCEERNETYIMCSSGICIPIAARCDTYNDCKDNTDEKNCETIQSSVELPTTKTASEDYDYASQEETIASRLPTHMTSFSTTAATKLSVEDEQVSSSTRVTYSSPVSVHLKASTSYYEKRLKETDSERDHDSRIFSKPVPTRAYRVDHPVSQTFPRIFTTPSSAVKTHNVSSWRSPISAPESRITNPSRRIDQQRQNFNPGYNPYQAPVLHNPVNQYQRPAERYRQRISNHPSNRYHSLDTQQQSHSNSYRPSSSSYQPHSNSYKPLSNSYQPSSNSHQPSLISNHHSSNSYRHLPNSEFYQHSSNSHQPSSSQYQPSSNQYQPSSNQYQPSSNQYQPFSNQYQPSSNQYQPSSNQYQSSSNQYQPSSNQYQPSSNRYQPHHSIPNTSHNSQRSGSGQRNYRDQINHFKSYGPKQEIRRPFNFVKDYSSLFVNDIRDGVDWILRQRTDSGDWGKDTMRAVVALALSSNNSFFNGNNDGEIIKKRFLIQIGADLLKNKAEDFNLNRMFMAINGLLAVCEDPTDFHGIDLAEKLRHKIDETKETKRRSIQNPFVLLSLCLSSKSLTRTDIDNLLNLMSITVNMNEKNKDTAIAAIMAFSCHVHQTFAAEDSNYSRSLRNRLNSAVSQLLEHVAEDGSFGSVYTTALAAQALMSTNETYDWDSSKTMNFLKHHQLLDGSFGNLLATYWALPALSGRSLLHLRNINCNPVKRELTPEEILEFVGPKQHVHYSLYFGYPLVNSQSMYLYLPQGINFLDVMRVAAYQNHNFRFSLENNSTKVYSLSGLPNDSEMGQFWHLYIRQESSSYLREPDIGETFIGDLKGLSPKPGEIFVFWYHSNELN